MLGWTAAATLSSAIYLLLAVAALLSAISPLLADLSSHGKTRASGGKSYGGDCNTNAKNRQRVLRGLGHFVLTRLTVSKRRFADFYAAGIVATLFVTHSRIRTSPLSHGTNGIVRREWLPMALLTLHLIRRYCECKWVQKSTSASRMHAAGYLLGIVHYLCLPFVMVPQLLHSTCESNHSMNNNADKNEANLYGECDASSWYHVTHYATTRMFVADVIPSVCCIYFQYQQHRHHVILANLRATESNVTYAIPKGGWFEYASCPHYFSEIMIYYTFAMLLSDKHLLVFDCENDEMTSWHCVQSSWLGDTLSWMGASYIFTAMTMLHELKHWVLFVWVATNLTVSAIRTHDWYVDNYKASYPKQRKRLIPFVW